MALIHREWGDLWDDVFTVEPLLDANGAFQTTDTGAFLIQGVNSSIQNLDQAERELRSVQLQLQKRYSNNWQFLGSYTWSESEGNLFENDAFDDFADFSDLTGINDPRFQSLLQQDLANRYGPSPYDREHQLKLFGLFRVPLGKHGLTVGSAFRFESGTPYATQADGIFTIARFLTTRDANELPDLLQLDLSLGLDVRLAKGFDLEIKAEVFNVTDEQDQIGVDPFVAQAELDGQVTNPGNFGQPRTIFDLQRPRNFRLTLGLRF